MDDAVRKNVEGLKLYQEGKYEEALRKYNEAIEMDAGYAAPWINRSAVHRKLGREADADDDMKWYESLRQAERTEKVKQRREAEASAYIERAERKAKRNIMAAVGAGATSGVATLILSIIEVLGYSTWWGLIDTFIVFGLTFGVYKKSRVCAIILFVAYVGPRIWMMVTQPEAEVIWSSLSMSIAFGYLFFLGIIGTFAYHRIIKAEAKQGIAIEQSPKT
jgi:tetratricopeptide (TPR) repeat protein